MIHFLRQCQREIADFPESVREDLADALARLDEGHKLSMPLSRPMPAIGKRVHELRLRDASGIYRIIYVILDVDGIWLLYAFKKKSQQTQLRDIELAKKRLKEIVK